MNRRDDDLCCIRAGGMCAFHARGILPQLKQPSWYRMAEHGDWRPRKRQKGKRTGPQLHEGMSLERALHVAELKRRQSLANEGK